MARPRSLLRETAADVRRSWKSLALTDLAYKLIALMVLTPVTGVLFRTMLSVSGSAVLADQDILFFFLGPLGWVCLIVVGALWIGIVALEQSALLAVLASGESRIGPLAALHFATANAWPVIQVTARLTARTLLAVAPFLVLAGLVYMTLLGEYDINYYLREKPPVFIAALVIAGLLVSGMLLVVLKLFTGWFFALPLVLFEQVIPRRALRLSQQRAFGHRRAILRWIIGWFVATLVVSSVTGAAVVGLARLVVPHTTGSLALLATAVGLTMTLWSTVNVAVSLLSTTFLAAMSMKLYRQLGASDQFDVSELRIGEPPTGGLFALTRGRLLAGGVIGVLVAVTVGALAMQGVRMEDRATVTAHRGASAAAPENTMAAFERAIEDGADWIELDVQETADGQVVVFHDSDFMKLAGENLKIWDATANDLQRLDIGSWFDPKYSDQRVPTLGQVLDACKGRVKVNIELKYYGHDQQLEQRVVDIVEAHNMADQIVVMSLKIDAVKKMKALRPNWQVGLLMSVTAGDLDSIEADFLAVNASFVARDLIQSANASGKDVYVWTVNDAATMSVMMSRGVDSLITDEPALARSVIRERASLSGPERLLLELAGLFGVTPQFGEP